MITRIALGILALLCFCAVFQLARAGEVFWTAIAVGLCLTCAFGASMSTKGPR